MTTDAAIYPEVDGPNRDSSPVLAALLDVLLQKHGNGVNGVLLYGSCLRSGDLHEGLVDLYLVVDNYRAVYPARWLAAGNWLLPPNVFYAEAKTPTGTVRSKYAVVSSADLSRGTSTRWFESYLWGRFAQPIKIAYSRDSSSRLRLQTDLRQAVVTFLGRCLPACPAEGSVRELWQHSLALSYNTELRSERSGRAAELVELSAGYFEAVTRMVAADLAYPCAVEEQQQQWRYRAEVPPSARRWAKLAWRARAASGTLLSLARLSKALFTFDGGLDYIAWKLERHSGQRVIIPDKVRRRPLVHVWALCWQLYRRGVFK